MSSLVIALLLLAGLGFGARPKVAAVTVTSTVETTVWVDAPSASATTAPGCWESSESSSSAAVTESAHRASTHTGPSFTIHVTAVGNDTALP
ncbi:hypothetical protein GGS23DRAFT_591993 [Durotheca rogersii]|uniref:uncharacterized protein n=1 Tax=Durotheca rogersii TaxID=419775 RepID=UPI00221F01E4|nr:uncharacterized protein GGS23DRAFT_591993 [Durotheca rogersii]KAI5868202.1 hypothetical protein GGS23DRAFT_591993 [Durotheca rogersii]